ncbi:PIN-like domain-containing protein [Lysinibacillus sp. NPDC098008]|uniref:PIN-like domain-containing protein n=1 Tax=Lysinibacillus sp. NPDC098008 TaxID=3364146 RepID=UPI00381C7E80
MTVIKDGIIVLEDLKEFIDKGKYIVVVDSCILLDFYRYNSKTAQEILNNLEYLGDKVWIPHQVYIEFKRNFASILGPNHNKYKNIPKSIASNVKDFENKLNRLIKAYDKYNFPKVNELGEKIKQHLISIENEANQYKEEIKTEMELMSELLRTNKILEYVENLKNQGQVGIPFSPTRILSIVDEGRKRFDLNIPPGYKDINKSEIVKEDLKVVDPLAPFGDLIVWKALIAKAKVDKVNVIFTTSDSKPDWWELDSNKNILSPREELIAEFIEETEGEVEFLMLPMKEFINKFSLISNISSLYSNVELSANEILQERLWESGEEIKDILIDNAYHAHLGNIEDVEDFEIVSVKIEDTDVEFDDEKVNLTTQFQIEASGYFIEYINRDYSESTQITMNLKGNYSVEIELDIENQDYTIDDWEISDLIISSSKIHYEEDYSDLQPWEYCSVCLKNSGEHELHPDERICNSCSQNSNYMLCTNCGTFYRHEDYDGDGQYCGRCQH